MLCLPLSAASSFLVVSRRSRATVQLRRYYTLARRYRSSKPSAPNWHRLIGCAMRNIIPHTPGSLHPKLFDDVMARSSSTRLPGLGPNSVMTLVEVSLRRRKSRLYLQEISERVYVIRFEVDASEGRLPIHFGATRLRRV
ncbi:hypothetical protein B0H11DRAFT_2108547 [Mycena galericulata]|nr:hypothetical protein B0H11DRAFT_2108547 [Mycena galericulata]